jgi:hypothetical protein
MLEYIALGTLIFMAFSLLFGAVAIVDIPYNIAVERNHPHQDAIRQAGWISLFTLHALWPLVWVWAAACSEDPVPRFSRIEDRTAINDKAEPKFGAGVADEDITDSVTLLGHRYEVLDDRIDRIEKAIMAAGEAA